MPQYTEAQLEQAFLAAGGPPAWAQTMAAVGMAESGGNSDAKNASGATGPWQTIMSAQDAAFQAKYGHYDLTNLQQAAEVAVAQLAGGKGITNWEADPVGAAAVANNSQPLSTQQLATVNTGGTSGTSATGTAPIPTSTFEPPLPGVNPKDFHGIDLSGVPTNELGNAERALQQQMAADPNYLQTLQQRIGIDFGYHGDWITKIPQLYGVLVWASTLKDPTSAAAQNEVESAIQGTQWYQTTSQFQRAWEQAVSTDPATADAALRQAQDKVLSTANEVGVNLTKNQLDSIAHMYASMSYEPSGTYSSLSGTSQEWLDQAVVDTVLNVKATGNLQGSMTNENFAGGVTDLSGASNPTQLSDVAQSLYQGFLGAAQSYLLYNPSDPGKSLISQQQLMQEVDKSLQGYTGSGASGQITQFVNGEVAKYTEQLKAQAKSVYPGMSTLIDQGVQPSSYIEPLANNVANTLGMSQGQINVMDPQWNWLINSTGKDGSVGPVTMDQALQKVTSPNFSWTDPNGQRMTYLQTSSGQQIQNQLAQQFAGAFGKGA